MALRYQAVKQGGSFEVVPVEVPVPGAGEILIKLKAIALNPVDWKQLASGHAVTHWPATFGNDGAGIVEAIGEGVAAFKKGDEVLARFDPVKTISAAFQNFAVIGVNNVAYKPKSLSFEEAASIPLAYMTAASAIHWALGVPLRFLKDGQNPGFEPKSVMVLGGSSSVGSATVQLLLIALPDASLISTSSPKHHALIKSLGANTVLDYTAADIVQEIYTASPGGSGVEAIVDTVNGVVTNPELLQTLTGPKQFTEVVTGQMATDIPAEIKHTLVFGRKVMTTSGGPNLFSALGVLLASGEYKPPLPITVVGKGLESIGEGLEKLKAGVSGTKLVIKL